MKWVPYNALTQTVTSSVDTYTVLTNAYDDIQGVFSWTIAPALVPWNVMVYSGKTLDKTAIEALITTFEKYPPPPEPLPPENTDGV
jgi:hypothetical protein